eukprot:s2378_g9.t1
MDGQRLPLHQLLEVTSTPYTLHSRFGAVERIQPDGFIMLAISHEDQYHVITLRAGQFVFEGLRQLGIHHVNFLIDYDGKVYGADFRVWRSLNLITLDPSSWPPSFPSSAQVAGGTETHLGLHDGHVWTALRGLFPSAYGSHPLLIHPAIASLLLSGGSIPDVLSNSLRKRLHDCDGQICCIFAAKGHWALLWGQADHSQVHWSYSDGLPALNRAEAGQLAVSLTVLLDLDQWSLDSWHLIPQHDGHSCGTIALLHACAHSGLFGLPSQEQGSTFHQWILDHLPGLGTVTAFGLPPDYQKKLVTLLVQHGVPADRATERANQITQKLGVSAIFAAFVSKTPWASLKAAANKPSVAFRLVQPDELSRHVASTASSTYGARVENAKGKKKKSDKRPAAIPLTLDPDQLALHHTYFKDSEDDVVPQLSFDEVEAEAHGIAICTPAQGHHLIQMTQSMSSHPLAILPTERPSPDVLEQYNLKSLTFAAKYKGTGEPVLIHGALKNLGDIPVQQHLPGNLELPALIQTQVIKVHIFKDEYIGCWTQLTQSPVRALCQAVPLLQLCPGRDCGSDCPKSHAAVDEDLDSILLEISSRSFTKLDGGKIAAPEADVFGVFLRIPASILDSLLQCGQAGIYIEPRSSETKSHDERYRVIRLPAKTLDEAQHACRTSVHALGLARMKRKYGLRVLAEHEEQTFKLIKPDAIWIDAQVQRVFQLFPLPHGLQRAGIVKLLKSISWAAKPLQPGQGNAEAMSWQEMTDQLKDELTTAMQKQLADIQTQQPTASAAAEGLSSRQAATDKKINQLETSIHEIRTQNQQFTGWFTTMGQQMQTAEASIQGLQYTLSTHQAELQGLHHEIKNVSDNVGSAYKAEVAADMNERFDRLEALFSAKKARQE